MYMYHAIYSIGSEETLAIILIRATHQSVERIQNFLRCLWTRVRFLEPLKTKLPFDVYVCAMRLSGNQFRMYPASFPKSSMAETLVRMRGSDNGWMFTNTLQYIGFVEIPQVEVQRSTANQFGQWLIIQICLVKIIQNLCNSSRKNSYLLRFP